MKVYNIKDSRDFFEKLSACKGMVEIVTEDKRRIPLITEGAAKELSLMTSFEGTIKEMELFFQNQEDCNRIIQYLINKRHLAA
ncbi:MAG: polya polymerase [Lachnospiraceae bacterium]|nr:polya polymerase [Lachnospiraceae bacterium]